MVGIAELIAICKTALEQGPTLIAKLASIRLSDEQIALLTAAQTDGAFNVVELDAGLYPTVLVGQKSFAKPEDPATSARVYEAFSDLCSKGLVRHLSGNLFALTSALVIATRDRRIAAGTALSLVGAAPVLSPKVLKSPVLATL